MSASHNCEERISAAALWLSQHVDEITGNPLLELMSRFELSVLEAVAASKRAHALRFGGVRAD